MLEAAVERSWPADSEICEMLSELLEDAELAGVAWDAGHARLRLSFACLRRDDDGSSLVEAPVEIDLADCEAIAIGHVPGILSIKPSEYRLARWVQLHDRENWPFDLAKMRLAVNSPQAEEDLQAAFRLDWPEGTPARFATCKIRLVLSLDNTLALGLPTNTVMLAFGAREWTASSDGVALDLATWERQLADWWKSWDRHWQEKKAKPHGSEPALEDTIIPLRPDLPRDVTYLPPKEPAVDLLPSDVPDALIRPLRTWFEALHERDWDSAAAVWQDLDLTREEQMRRHEEAFGWRCGRWGYARQVDAWWIEDSLGQVSIRGVEHKMAHGKRPASNFESLWTFRLRLRDGRWVIREVSQAWPAFGSAPARAAAEKPWLQDWGSGSVVSERPLE